MSKRTIGPAGNRWAIDASELSSTRWRCQRVFARIEQPVEAIVAEHATSYWQRGARRHDTWPGRDRADAWVRWTIDDELVLEFHVGARGPGSLIVHDFGLFEPLHRALRTRHVRVRHATARDGSAERSDPR